MLESVSLTTASMLWSKVLAQICLALHVLLDLFWVRVDWSIVWEPAYPGSLLLRRGRRHGIVGEFMGFQPGIGPASSARRSLSLRFGGVVCESVSVVL